MKLAIAGLLLIAICSVNASFVARSPYVTYECPNIALSDPDGGAGVVVRYKGGRRPRSDYCTIQISAPPGQTLHLDIQMENVGGNMYPDCTNGGRLIVYAGPDASGQQIVNACDAYPMSSFDLSTNQAYVTFEKDAIGDNFVIQALFKSKRNDATLLEKLDHLGEKTDKKKKHHHHHSHH